MQKNQIKLAVSALALTVGMTAIGSSADAATALYSGGGTLASKVYRQIFNCYGAPLFGSTAANTVEGATTPFPSGYPAGGSTPECSKYGTTTQAPYVAPFNATAAAVEFMYAPVGSGNGLKAYTTDLASNLGTPATSNQVAFTTAAFAAYPYPALDFAGSDAALTTTQVGNIGKSNGLAAIQMPAFGTPIALPFNGPGFTYPTNFTKPVGGSSKLVMSITAVCGIFTGGITNWNDATLTANNGKVPLVKSSEPIIVYVRADGSGTSQIFSTWLKVACASTHYPTAPGFQTTTTPNWPSSFLKVSGSGGIADAVAANQYAIGYDSPDFVAPVVSTGSPTVNVQDPTGVAEPPSAAAATAAISAATAPSSPAAYNWGQPINTGIDNLSKSATNYPKGAYPITGFTFLDFYQCYSASSTRNPQAANNLTYFLTNFYLASSGQALAEVDKILNDNGFGRPKGAFQTAEQNLISNISYTGSLNGVPGSSACNAPGVVGING